jgi:hypothetical protein
VHISTAPIQDVARNGNLPCRRPHGTKTHADTIISNKGAGAFRLVRDSTDNANQQHEDEQAVEKHKKRLCQSQKT